MDARNGKEIRMGRVFRPADNRSVTVAYSHGVLLGPDRGYLTYTQMDQMMKVFQGADAIMLSPGMLNKLNHHYIGRDRPGLILEADWQNVSRTRQGAFSGNGCSTALMTAEEAVVAGADAIMTYLWMGGNSAEAEAEEISRNAYFARACESVGLPLMIESRGFDAENYPDGTVNLELLALHTRIAAELGADFIKTKYSGSVESFREITEQCPVPILVAGGSRQSTVEDTFRLVGDVISGGGAGVVFGRNIFQFDEPEFVLDGIVERVHPSL